MTQRRCFRAGRSDGPFARLISRQTEHVFAVGPLHRAQRLQSAHAWH